LRASKDSRKHGAERHPSRLAEDGAHLTGDRYAFVPGMTAEFVAPIVMAGHRPGHPRFSMAALTVMSGFGWRKVAWKPRLAA